METEAEVVECIICFSEIEDKGDIYTCGDSNCYSPVCGDCVSLLIEYSEADGKLPKCCNIPKCKNYYLYNDIKRLSKKTVKLYENCFLKYMTTTNGTEIQKDIEQLKILAKIREHRMIFIKASFPVAIAKLAEFSFANKLKRIDKTRVKLIKDKMKLAHRTCMNLTCSGFLTDDLTCMTCSTKFCNKCEKRLESGHVCKPEDVESINIIKEHVRCPTCKLPVFKEIGCDHITCSNCNTRFFYTTGKAGGAGNHGQNERINVINSRKLSKLFDLKKFPTLENELKKLEKHKPKEVERKYWVGPLKDFYANNNKKGDVGRKLAMSFDKYSRFLLKSRRYQLCMNEAERIINEFISSETEPEGDMNEEQLEVYNTTLDSIKTLM